MTPNTMAPSDDISISSEDCSAAGGLDSVSYTTSRSKGATSESVWVQSELPFCVVASL